MCVYVRVHVGARYVRVTAHLKFINTKEAYGAVCRFGNVVSRTLFIYSHAEELSTFKWQMET